MVTVKVEGARAVVADMVTGARLCLALIYVWERRGKGQSCAKGTESVWHGQGKGWRRGMSGAAPGDTKAGILPLLGPKAAGWQMSLLHQLLHSHSLSILPPALGL